MSRINMTFNDPRAALIRKEAAAGDMKFADAVRELVDEALAARSARAAQRANRGLTPLEEDSTA